MLSSFGPQQTFCDRRSRRSFLQWGTLGLGGLTLADLVQAETASRSAKSHKAVIMVYLSGGIAHQDTFDLKPNAPDEVRGEFKPIDTAVPGVRYGELLPALAKVADRTSLLRAVVGQRDEHTSFQNMTGFGMNEAQRDKIPHFGSLVAKVQGSTDAVVPPFVDLFPTMQHKPYNSTGAGYLGPAYNQVRADSEDLANMKLREIEPVRLESRRELLAGLDILRRSSDRPAMVEMGESYRRAFDVLTSSKVVDALDLSRVPASVRNRYALGDTKHLGDGAPLHNDHLLMALRLVEAGVRVVTVAYGFWDTHGGNFTHLKKHLPTFDAGLAALVEDIHDRGLADEVTLVVWGEFGRTPKINKQAGRDHWAPVQSVLVSGGGMRMGQVIGATDAQAAYAERRAIHYRDVLATVYHRLGIDPHRFVRDINERPVPLLPHDTRPIPELVG